MSTMQARPDRTFRQRWTDFWFAPADPTMLGFIRIVAGVLILYLHLSYTADLYRFFGKVGWWGHDYIERERNEYPWVHEKFFTWDQSGVRNLRPEYPHRSKAVMDFIRSLPASKADRERGLAYLHRLMEQNNQEATQSGLQYVMLLPEVNEKREEELAKIIENAPQDANAKLTGALPVPVFFRTLPKDQREAVVQEIRRFLALLPPYGALGDSPRTYVLNHLREMDLDNLRAFDEFVINLPDDPVEREKLIEYVDYWNIDRRRVGHVGHNIFSLWFHITEPNTMMAAHIGVIAFMVLFTAGLFTRVTSVITWLAALSYIHRSQQVLFGMDTMMSILLFYLMIGNCGAALSLDRLFQKRRAIKASLARCGTIDEQTKAFLAAPAPSVTAGLAIRLIQVHFCFIYLASGLSKLKGAAWWNGVAIWEVMVNPEFTLLRYKPYEWTMRTIASVKPLYYAFLAFSTWFTLFLEIGLPFLIWTRLRPWLVFLAVLLHAGIGILMGLNLFELMMLAMLLAYIPGVVVREWLGSENGSKEEANANKLPTVMGRVKPVRSR